MSNDLKLHLSRLFKFLFQYSQHTRYTPHIHVDIFTNTYRCHVMYTIHSYINGSVLVGLPHSSVENVFNDKTFTMPQNVCCFTFRLYLFKYDEYAYFFVVCNSSLVFYSKRTIFQFILLCYK